MSDSIIHIPYPVKGGFIPPGGGFAASRTKQAGNTNAQHTGIDLAVAIGTPVHAPLTGIVTILPTTPRAGMQMRLQHPGGYITGYAHLSKIIVNDGDAVSVDQIIAYTGDTGDAVGHPHLHFTLRKNGVPVNPYPYLTGTVSNSNSVVYTPESTTSTILKDYTDVIVVDDKYTTNLNQFISKYSITMTPEDLLAYKDNNANVLAGYSKKQKLDNNNQASVDLITVGTKINVPLWKMKSNNPYRVNQNLMVNLDYKTFIEAEIAKLIRDPKYKRLNLLGNDTTTQQGAIYKKISHASIWVWSRVISPNGRYLIDVSPFLKSIEINVTKEGGNFQLNLANLLFNDSTKDYESSGKLTSNVSGNLNATELVDLFQLPIITIDRYQSSEFHYNNFYSKNSSHTIEKLNINDFHLEPPRKDEDISDNPNYFKLKKSLFHYVIQANDLLFIRLEKLEIDQSDYFDLSEGYTIIDSKAIQGKVFDMIALVDAAPLSLAGQNNQQSVTVTGRDLSKLLLDDGVFFFPVEYAVQDKEQIIKNSGKNKSGNRLTITLPPNKDYQSNLTLHVGNGNMIGDTLFNFDVTQTLSDWLLFLFQQLTNISICPNGLFNSYKDKTFVVSRNDKFASDGSFGYQRIAAEGIWQIVKLVLDPNISERRIADASLSTDTGSLINLVKKICQEPFAEFTSDTWGDKFYFTLRKPPFVRESFKTNKIMNVFDYDVLNSNFSFSQDFYSWFRLTPMGSIIDTSDGTMMQQIPAVMLPEYVELWGTKILDVQTNYLDWGFTEAEESSKISDNILKQASEDLDWLLEAYAYLPFTRQGTLTIKADRRIKRGMCIRFFSTGEIFHVDGVNNSRNFEGVIQSSTTLQVSRGIVEKHFDKYFSIVNLKKNGVNKNTWSVNRDIFNFFVSRQQFLS